MENEKVDAGRDSRTSRETQFPGANREREKILIFPVQLDRKSGASRDSYGRVFQVEVDVGAGVSEVDISYSII